MSADFEQRVDELLDSPQSMSADGQSVANRSVDDLLKAEAAKNQKKATRRRGFGLRAVAVNFPGSAR